MIFLFPIALLAKILILAIKQMSKSNGRHAWHNFSQCQFLICYHFAKKVFMGNKISRLLNDSQPFIT